MLHDRNKNSITSFSSELEEIQFLLDNADLQIWFQVDERTYGRANKVHADFMGLKREEIEGRPIEEVLSEEEEVRTCIDTNRKVVREKRRLETEEWVKNGAGEKRLLSITRTPRLDEEGEVQYIVFTAEDITRKRRLEKKLKENRQEYEELVEKVNEGIVIVDENEDFQFANPAAEELFGVGEGELVGRNIREFVSEEEYNDKILPGTERRKQGEEGRYELNINRPDGERRILQVVVTPRWDEGEYTGAFSVLRDITESKERQEKLQLARFSINKASVGILWISPSGKFKYVNDTICGMLGYEREELLGQSISFVDPNYREEDREKRWQHLKEKGYQSVESEHVTSEGEHIPVWIRSHHLNFHGQEYEFAFVQDISERRQVEDKLKKQKQVIEELHETALRLRELKSEREVCQLTVDTAEKLLEFNICNCSLVEGEMLVPVASSSGVPTGGEKASHISEGIAGRTYRKQESVLTTDIDRTPGAKPVSSTYRSAISVPIGEHGVFQAVARKKAAFSQEDLELAELLIAHTSAALDRIYSREQIRYKTFHDELTGLYNRTYLEQEMERLDTERQLPLSIIMVDINGLKIINDSFGHEVGDEIIRRTAGLLQESLRQEDILARWAGDEFVVLLPRTDRSEASRIVSRIEERCQQTRDERIPISVGIGLGIKTDKDTDIYDVLSRADEEMYSSKLAKDEKAKNLMVKSLLSTMRAKSPETEEHSRRMVNLARQFGEKLGLKEPELRRLKLLASVHDIGKVTISEDILNKPGDLNSEEWEIVKQHSERGYRIVFPTEEFMQVAEEVLSHHERWDGGGYPRGLSGADIPYLARIIFIIDTYDVMTNDQPYRDAVSSEEALEEIAECAGSQFDPDLAEKFVQMMSD